MQIIIAQETDGSMSYAFRNMIEEASRRKSRKGIIVYINTDSSCPINLPKPEVSSAIGVSSGDIVSIKEIIREFLSLGIVTDYVIDPFPTMPMVALLGQLESIVSIIRTSPTSRLYVILPSGNNFVIGGTLSIALSDGTAAIHDGKVYIRSITGKKYRMSKDFNLTHNEKRI